MALSPDGRIFLDDDLNSDHSTPGRRRTTEPDLTTVTDTSRPRPVTHLPSYNPYPTAGITFLVFYMLMLMSLIYYLETTYPSENIQSILDWIILFVQAFGIFGIPAIAVALISRFWSVWGGIALSIIGIVTIYYGTADMVQQYSEASSFILFPVLSIIVAILFRMKIRY